MQGLQIHAELQEQSSSNTLEKAIADDDNKFKGGDFTIFITKIPKSYKSVRIKRLSGEFEDRRGEFSGRLVDTDHQTADAMSTTPALPPGLAELNSVSREDFLKEMERHPLFMHNLDPTAEENLELEALQALAYEGTPTEIAANFKTQGNEAYREKRFRDALEFYSKGLAAKCGDEELESALLLNRAAVNLELGM